MIYTTTAVGIGFAVLGISRFTLVEHLGLLTAAIMVLCLLADLLLLPALLLPWSAKVKIAFKSEG